MTEETLPQYTRPPEYEDEQRYLLLESGSIYDRQKARIVYTPPGGGKFAITPETSAAMKQRRQDLIRQRVEQALDEGADIPEEKWGQGFGAKVVTEHMVRTFLKSSNLRGMGETFSKLLSAAGYTTNENEQGPSDNNSQMREIISMLAQALAKTREEPQRETIPQGDVIEGKISE